MANNETEGASPTARAFKNAHKLAEEQLKDFKAAQPIWAETINQPDCVECYPPDVKCDVDAIAEELQRVRAAMINQDVRTPEFPPTHRCDVCGAYWRLRWAEDYSRAMMLASHGPEFKPAEPDYSAEWMLISQVAMECCSKDTMREQIRPMSCDDVAKWIHDHGSPYIEQAISNRVDRVIETMTQDRL